MSVEVLGALAATAVFAVVFRLTYLVGARTFLDRRRPTRVSSEGRVRPAGH